jgi:hypothetical protein
MKRTDWIGAFVTLVATGIGYFVSGPRAAAACIVIGTLGALILHFATKDKPDNAGAGKADVGVKDSFNPIQKQEFNPVFAPKFEMTIPQPPSSAPVVPHSIPPWKQKACLVIRKPKVGYLRLDEYGVWVAAAKGQGPKALLLPIYHDPRQTPSGAHAYHVRVHLVFKEKGKEEDLIIPAACWLQHSRNSLELGSGKVEEAILFVMSRTSPIAFTNDNDDAYDYDADKVKPTGLMMVDYEVDITLIWGGNNEFSSMGSITISAEETKAMLLS